LGFEGALALGAFKELLNVDEAEAIKWLEPGFVWAVRKGLTYGLTVAATALGVKEGWDLTWVAPAAVALGTLFSHVTARLLKWMWARRN
jgi:hypothetical protein